MVSASQFAKSGVPTWILWPSVILVVVTYVIPGLFSTYRAWVQVHSLDLIVARPEIRTGDTVRVRSVSWARTRVHVDLQLVQGARSTTLGAQVIPDNHNPSIDPRWKRDSIVVVLTQPLLAHYNRGEATLRAIAIGGPQWLRTPPPLIRETVVTLVSTLQPR
jgi:hypothetical protein